jgi:Uma2 family endonuclease
MATATLERTMTEVPDVPDGYERVDGDLVEVEPMSFYSVVVSNRLANAIRNHAPSNKRGSVWMGDLYFFVPTPEDPTKVRKPDLVYATFATWPADKALPYEGNAVAIVPDLVVEIISPTDDADAVNMKTNQYLKAGVKAVWVVYPGAREIYCYDAPRSVRVYGDGDTLDGGPVLPGFTLDVASIFPAIAPQPA